MRRAAAAAGLPLTWLNLVCLDAPLVAVSWQWWFARSFDVAVPAGATAALFLTAWLIYLADRFADSFTIRAGAEVSLRQAFCRRHRGAWVILLVLVAAADVVVIWRGLDRVAVLVGCAIGGCAGVYLLLNQLRPAFWRVLPLKEVSIGFIFAAGTMVGLVRSLPAAALPPWLFFAALCALNCICIAVWERQLDIAQQRISIATEFPRIERAVLPLLVLICLTSLQLPIALSAALLALVHLMRHRVEPNSRTALADLVLLTPLVS